MLLAALTLAAAGGSIPSPCTPGVHAREDRHYIVIMERPGTAENRVWRWWADDGRFGLSADWTVVCGKDAVLTAENGNSVAYPRIPLRLTPTKFKSGDLTLNGMLIEPPPYGRGEFLTK